MYERISLDSKKLRGVRLESGKNVQLVTTVTHGSGEDLTQYVVD